MTPLLKEAFFALVPKPRLPRDRAVILMYHSISDWEHFTTVSPKNFAAHMHYLAAHHYPVISLAELVCRRKAGEALGGSVVITFDDGYRDNLTVAYPILRQHDFPATVFVTTGWTAANDGIAYMTQGELRELQATGLVDIEPHSASHSHLPHGNQRDEIVNSKCLLEAWVGKPRRHFAAPYGDYNQETLAILTEVGIEAAVTVREGTAGPESSLLELPRVSIDSSTTPMQFRGKLSTAIDRYEALKLWR